jgi:hypothetical protein
MSIRRGDFDGIEARSEGAKRSLQGGAGFFSNDRMTNVPIARVRQSLTLLSSFARQTDAENMV